MEKMNIRDKKGRLFRFRIDEKTVMGVLNPREIEKNLNKVVELPEFNEDKKRGIIKLGERYCTLIYKKKKHGLIIITCWESNPTDVSEYHRVLKMTKGG